MSVRYVSSLTVILADKPTKKEDADLLEGAGQGLIEALEGV